jgi:hypothetical protein
VSKTDWQKYIRNFRFHEKNTVNRNYLSLIKKKVNMKACFVFGILSVLFFFSCEDQTLNKGQGEIKGKISIGPLCPVETIPPKPECQPTAETYKAYQTAVWTLTRKKVAEINPDSTGNFILKLNSGTYVIDFDNSSNKVPLPPPIGSSNLPSVIHIPNQDTVIFNITIDTGIR